MYLDKNELCHYIYENLRYKNRIGITNLLSDIQDLDFARGQFEILSEEIDIDSIEELDFENVLSNKINELVKAVKKLNRKE